MYIFISVSPREIGGIIFFKESIIQLKIYNWTVPQFFNSVGVACEQAGEAMEEILIAVVKTCFEWYCASEHSYTWHASAFFRGGGGSVW